jgi:ribonuclease HI
MQVYVAAYTMAGKNAPYGLACVIIDQFDKQAEITDSGKRSKGTRAELKAVIAGLDDCVDGAEIKLYVTSKYLYHGLTEGLPEWRESNWKSGKIAHIDLWASISRLMDARTVEVVYIENHRTSRLMAHCVDLATEAAVAVASLENPE